MKNEMKTVSSKTYCEVYNEEDKLVIKGQFGQVCKKLFAAGIIPMLPNKCYTKLDNQRTVEDWNKIAFYIDDLLKDGYKLILGECDEIDSYRV